MLVSEVLETQGYTILEAEDGPSGLRILDSNARIDLLITDVGLPGGLTAASSPMPPGRGGPA